MSALPTIDMMEATRLTREGRLAEAMAVLRGALAGAPSAARSNFEGDAGGTPAMRTPPILNMLPPLVRNGGAWTLPELREAHTNRRAGMSQPQIPEALRQFLDRIGQRGSARGIDGLSGRALPPLPDGALFEERVYANAAGSREAESRRGAP